MQYIFKVFIKNNLNLICEKLKDYLKNYIMLSNIFNSYIRKKKNLQLFSKIKQQKTILMI